MLGVVVALPSEARAIMGRRGWRREDDFKFACRSTRWGPKLLCVRSGIGANRAERAARWLVGRGAEALGVFGVSGGLNPVLEFGATVIADTILSADRTGATGRWVADPEFADSFFHESASKKLPVFRGPIATTKHPVFSREEKKRLFHMTGAFAVDLESAAVARVAAGENLPFLAVRTICDCAADDLPAELYGLLDARGILCGRILMTLLWRHPGYAVEMVRYGRRFSKALKSLRAAFKIFEKNPLKNFQ
ncbi:MAG: hypothetical protein C4530_23710 [Desulfobacteraceae bacterium]|nr:MAG: hypothetical protein C4530_23710 [Desulfobacteraceae bacterium]